MAQQSRKKSPDQRVARLQLQLVQFREVADEARASSSWTAAVAALAKAREVEAEIGRVHATVDLGTTRSPEVRLRRCAELAMMDGSFTAAASLEREAEEMRRARVAAESLAKEAAQAGADPLTLIASLVGLVGAWPAALRDRLVAELVSAGGVH